jgi:hypothetical protein
MFFFDTDCFFSGKHVLFSLIVQNRQKMSHLSTSNIPIINEGSRVKIPSNWEYLFENNVILLHQILIVK